MTEINITEYAAHRRKNGLPGGSRQAVYKAIETGRITLLANGKINPLIADEQWLFRTLLRIPSDY